MVNVRICTSIHGKVVVSKSSLHTLETIYCSCWNLYYPFLFFNIASTRNNSFCTLWEVIFLFFFWILFKLIKICLEKNKLEQLRREGEKRKKRGLWIRRQSTIIQLDLTFILHLIIEIFFGLVCVNLEMLMNINTNQTSSLGVHGRRENNQKLSNCYRNINIF